MLIMLNIFGGRKMDKQAENQMVNDILCAAFEGGSTYWAGEVSYKSNPKNFTGYASDSLSAGVILNIKYEDGLAELTYDKMLKGIKAEAERRGLTVKRFYEEHDAVYADGALQMALFDELVYG